MAPLPRTREELDALAVLDPEIDAIMKSNALPLPKFDLSNGYETPLKALRALEAAWPTPPPVPDVVETKLQYTARDGAVLDLFVFSRGDGEGDGVDAVAVDAGASTEPKPLIVYFHGGGGVIGSAYSVAPLALDLVRDHDCVVVSPQYRLAPEHAFPRGVEDAWDAVSHIAGARPGEIHPSIDVSTTGLVLGGASQGAVLSSLLALRAKHHQALPCKITGLFFAAGSFITDLDSVPEKYRAAYVSRTDDRCMSAPIYNVEMKALFEAAYAPDMTSPLYRAFNITPLEDMHVGLAESVYFQVCGADMLRDDSLIYAEVLRDVGGAEGGIKVDVFEGAPHVFWTVFARTRLGQRWKSDTRDGVRWLLGRDEDAEVKLKLEEGRVEGGGSL